MGEIHESRHPSDGDSAGESAGESPAPVKIVAFATGSPSVGKIVGPPLSATTGSEFTP